MAWFTCEEFAYTSTILLLNSILDASKQLSSDGNTIELPSLIDKVSPDTDKF